MPQRQDEKLVWNDEHPEVIEVVATECGQNAAAKLRNGQRAQRADGPFVLCADLCKRGSMRTA